MQVRCFFLRTQLGVESFEFKSLELTSPQTSSPFLPGFFILTLLSRKVVPLLQWSTCSASRSFPQRTLSRKNLNGRGKKTISQNLRKPCAKMPSKVGMTKQRPAYCIAYAQVRKCSRNLAFSSSAESGRGSGRTPDGCKRSIGSDGWNGAHSCKARGSDGFDCVLSRVSWMQARLTFRRSEAIRHLYPKQSKRALDGWQRKRRIRQKRRCKTDSVQVPSCLADKDT